MPRRPNIAEVLTQVLDAHSSRLRAIEPGEVLEFDRDNQTATVRPLVRDRAGEDRAVVHSVPVIQPVAYSEIQEGDTGILLVCDRDPSKWWRDDQVSDPETTATHSISNAVFLPGLRSQSTSEGLTIPADSVVVEKRSPGGGVYIGSASANKSVAHQDLFPDLRSFLSALTAWGTTTHVSFAAQKAAWDAGPAVSLATLLAGIAAKSYTSSSAIVEG